MLGVKGQPPYGSLTAYLLPILISSHNTLLSRAHAKGGKVIGRVVVVVVVVVVSTKIAISRFEAQ